MSANVHMSISYISILRRHFDRITVSLGDHNVKTYDDTKNVFRWKILIGQFFILIIWYQEVKEDCSISSIRQQLHKRRHGTLATGKEGNFEYTKGQILTWFNSCFLNLQILGHIFWHDQTGMPTWQLKHIFFMAFVPTWIFFFKGPLGVESTCHAHIFHGFCSNLIFFLQGPSWSGIDMSRG